MMDSSPAEFEKAIQLLRSALYNMNESYCLFDSDGMLAGWNDSLEADLPELLSITGPGIDYEHFLRVLLATGVSGTSTQKGGVTSVVGEDAEPMPGDQHLELRIVLSDNRCIQVCRVNLEPDGWMLVFKNISQAMQEQEALILEEEKFKRFARLASDWFWELDEELCYLYHSNHAAVLSTDDVLSLVGKSRIDSLMGKAHENDDLNEHNACLLGHKNVDVVLSFDSKDGSGIFYSHILAEPRYNSAGKFIGYIGCGKDVTATYELNAKFEYQANHDHLTGLRNRRAFESYLDTISGGSQHAGSTHLSCVGENGQDYSLVSIDLDRFKLVNDEAGHAAGDQLLVEVSQLIERVLGSSGIVARIGGDEFGACLNTGLENTKTLIDELLQQVSEYSFEWQNRCFSIGASAGIAVFQPDSIDSSTLLKNADVACYSAKMLGRNRKEVFSKNNYFQSQQSAEFEILRTLRSAMADDRIELYLQPIVTAQLLGGLDKFEVLLRVIDEHGKIIAPGDLIPTAEKYDVMQQVDLIVVEKSIKNIQAFIDQGADVSFSINLSGNTLGSERCLERIVGLVKNHPLPAGSLCFEITETAAINSLRTVVGFMDELKKYNCQFSLDDFGTGLSSYGYLESLDVDYIKIDGSFIKNIMVENTSKAIVKSINMLSHEMGMKTVAEFVENKDIADSVIAMDIDYLQGYHYGKPLSVLDVLDQYCLNNMKTGTG